MTPYLIPLKSEEYVKNCIMHSKLWGMRKVGGIWSKYRSNRKGLSIILIFMLNYIISSTYLNTIIKNAFASPIN